MGEEEAGTFDAAARVAGRDVARVRLSRLNLAAGKTLRQGLQEVAEIAATALNVNRVSVWRFINERSAIRCEFLYQPARKSHYEGTILHAHDFPNYFRALEVRRVVPVIDLAGDPLMDEFREAYFRPLGISAMVDAPIYEAGDVTAIVCHEIVGPPRSWTRQDCEFAATVAEVIARLHEEAARRRVELQRDTFEEQVTELQRLGDLGRLAAGLAHDFSNILHVVVGFAETIADATHEQTPLRPAVDGLMAALDRGVLLMTELKALGKAEGSRPRVLDVVECTNQMRELLAKAAGQTISLSLEIGAHVGQVFIDQSQYERALLNLVVNARDATPAGGPVAIAVREGRRANHGHDGGAYVVVEVTDRGVGMDRHTQIRMFEPLFTTKGDKGTGLGLAIVQQIVTLAGGFIEVESALGAGTIVRLFFPKIA
jgi:two-component system, cell cycle sensor histidine kinase and response regulator CckA